ncbi:MAG: hypothetical protein U0904_10875 [Candidatus Nanopelagicales bacterium]|nr:hypothetical protein [Candidatus Nanopelagicales bacterium]
MPRSINPWPTGDARATGNEAWSIMSRMITGLLLYGALGWLVGQWLGSSSVGVAVGSVIGLVVAMYASYLKVAAMDDGPLAVDEPGSPVSWSQRMTRVRVREARQSNGG